MKTLIVCSFLLFICVAKLRACPQSELCLTELDYDKSILEGSLGPQNKITEGNEAINNYWACCWKKRGFLTEDGQFNRENYLISMNRDADHLLGGKGYYEKGALDPWTTGLLDKCNGTDRSDPGDFVVKMKNCIITEFWKIGG